MLHQEYQRFPTATCSRCSPYSMDELVTVLRRVILNNPVNIGYINTPSGKISGQQNLVHPLFIIRLCFEFIVDLASLFLVDLPMQLEEVSLVT